MVPTEKTFHRGAPYSDSSQAAKSARIDALMHEEEMEVPPQNLDQLTEELPGGADPRRGSGK
eukprot:10506694-Karenia_brevis.AAC.1